MNSFGQYPAEVQAALLTGIGSILAAIIVGAIALLTLRSQLTHDRKQRQKNYEENIRSGIFLESALLIDLVMQSLTRLASGAHDGPKLMNDIADSMARLNKILLVSDSKTIDALLSFQYAINKTMAFLALKRVPLDTNKYKLDALTTARTKHLENQENITSEIKNVALTGTIEQLDFLQKRADFEYEQFTKVNSEFELLLKENALFQIDLLEMTIKECSDLTTQHRTVLLETIREQLSMPAIPDLGSKISANYEKSKAEIEKFIQDIRQKIL